MITTDSTARSSRYRIMESAISFTENYQDTNLHGNPIYDVVYVSLVSNASIMVYDANNGIDYGADLQYKRWRLNGAATGLVSPDAHNIYAKLSKTDSNPIGDIVFSTYNYTTQGVSEEKDAEGNPIKDYSDTHWMIKIGTLSALTSPSNEHPDRTLTFDPGKLGTQQDNNEKGGGWVAEMFDVVVDDPKRIKPLLWFDELKVLGKSIFDSIADFYKGFRIGNGENAKEITSVATDKSVSEDSDNAIATPAYVKAFSEGRYLRRDTQDHQSVSGPVTFDKDVTVQGNQSVSGNQSIQGTQSVQGQATFHDGARGKGYVEQGDLIQGWNIDKEGIASFAKVKTPSMQVYELTLNRKTAVQGEYIFSDGEVVEEVEDLGNGNYKLTISAPYEGYITTFEEYDILYSNINMIGASGESAKTGKCWMLVTSVEGSTIYATMYPDDECPDGSNIPPMPYMNISRHGNKIDETRQDVFIISSENSNMVMLRKVTAPKVSSEGLYGVVVGKLPQTLLDYINKDQGVGYVNGKDSYIYARGVIVQDLILLDYQGKPVPTERYRGDWKQDIANGLVTGEGQYRKTDTLVDTVTHNGSLWVCMYDRTTAEPQEDSLYWLKKVSKGDPTKPRYDIKPSVNVIYYRSSSDTWSERSLDIYVLETTSEGYTNIDSQGSLDARNLVVEYAIDGVGERGVLNISPSGLFELEDGTGIVATEDDGILSLEGTEISYADIKENITLYLVDTTTQEDISTFVVPVVRDGEEGKQGRMLYPAGVYDETREYKIENNSAPFVKEENTYYVLVWEGDKIRGIRPSQDAAGTYWRPFTYMNYLFAEFLMANWAKFGGDNGAVFYDRWLFSQKGREDNETTDSYYSDVTEPIFNSLSDFVGWSPNLALDFKNGKILAKDADITGHINATSGTFKGTLSGATGDFKGEITANKGNIGGFEIGESSIGSKDGGLYLSKEKIIFHELEDLENEVIVGSDASDPDDPLSGLVTQLLRLKTSEQPDYKAKYGAIIDVVGGASNFALLAKHGRIVGHSGVISTGFDVVEISGPTAIPVNDSSFVYILNYKVENTVAALPTIEALRESLNLSEGESFCVRMMFVNFQSSNEGYIAGRDWFTTDTTRPTIIGNNAETLETLKMGVGDVCEFLLISIPSGNYYTAHLINRST